MALAAFFAGAALAGAFFATTFFAGTALAGAFFASAFFAGAPTEGALGAPVGPCVPLLAGAVCGWAARPSAATVRPAAVVGAEVSARGWRRHGRPRLRRERGGYEPGDRRDDGAGGSTGAAARPCGVEGDGGRVRESETTA